jgi:hypothetical protein
VKKFVLFVLFTCSVLYGHSQKLEIGGEFGFVISSPTDNGYQVSLSTYFTPKHSIFFVNAGLSYQKIDNWNFIKFPFGIVVAPGKQVRFLMGTGLSVNHEFLQPKDTTKYNVNLVQDFSFNLYFLIGLSFNITKYLNFFIKPQLDIDLSNKNSFFSINIGVKYSILKKNN